MSGRVCALVLAAGASRRLGQPKAMVRLPTGETLLEHAVASTRGADLDTAVAVPPDDNAVTREAKRLDVNTVVVEDPSIGISASIRAAVSFAQTDPGVEAVLIMLADQWRLTTGHLVSLVDAWRASPSRMAAARYSGKLGVPAVFGREHFASLLSLRGDTGARDLLREAAGRVAALDLPLAEIDLDTPAEIARLATG